MTLEIDIDHLQGEFRLKAAFTVAGKLTALFGRSGSGKTTLVNTIAGLVRPQHGRIMVDGTMLLDTSAGLFVPRHRRRIGYVFQEGRLFPHLDVRQNLLFGRWFARPSGDAPGLAEVVALLGIGHLLARRPGSLSGGEKQRVAIGRALLAHPRILLMDEPLAALDEARKAELLPYIERLRDAANVPIIYVSHSLSEVARLADSVVIMENGRVVAAGSASAVLSRMDLPILDIDGEGGVVLDVTVARHDLAYNLSILALPGGELQVPLVPLQPGAQTRVRIRARDVILSLTPPHGLSALNVLAGKVVAVEGGSANGAGAAAASVLATIDCSGTILAARITLKSLDALRLHPGMPCHAIVKSVSLERGANLLV